MLGDSNPSAIENRSKSTSALLRRLVSIRDRLENVPVRHGAIIGAAVLAAFYTFFTALDSRRLLWHDELFTYYIAKAPSVAQLWQDLRLDLNPPLLYLAVRGSLRVFGDNLYATRLPSIFMFLIGSLCFYEFVAKRLRPIYGALVLLIVWASLFFTYATEARPYALVVGFFGLALLAYERAARPERKFLFVASLAGAVIGMMLSHFFSVFYIAPICLAELVRTYLRKKLDVPIWIALIVPCVIPFAYLKLVARFEESYFPLEFQATTLRGIFFYWNLLKAEAFPLLLAIIAALLAAWRLRSTHETTTGVGMPDLGVVIGLLAIPLIIEFVLARSHGAFFPRYAILGEFGLAIVLAILIGMYTGFTRISALAACFVLTVFLFSHTVGFDARRSNWATYYSPSAAEQSKRLESIDPGLPLVAASGLTFLEMDRYASAAVVGRLYYLTDRRLATQVAHATIFEGFSTLKNYFPIRANVTPYREFTRDHSQFLVLGTLDYPEDWLLRHLLRIHAHLEFLGDVPGPYKDTNLFLVTMPARSVD